MTGSNGQAAEPQRVPMMTGAQMKVGALEVMLRCRSWPELQAAFLEETGRSSERAEMGAVQPQHMAGCLWDVEGPASHAAGRFVA